MLQKTDTALKPVPAQTQLNIRLQFVGSAKKLRSVQENKYNFFFPKAKENSISHLPSPPSQYPFLWAVSYVDETNLSFLHIVDLNFPARVTRTQFLCEAKVQAMAVISDSATEDNPEVRSRNMIMLWDLIVRVEASK